MLAPLRGAGAELATARWEALGTTVVVRLAHAGALAEARKLVEAELAAIDHACSRFRADSELERANASAGRFVPASPLLVEAVQTALRGAWLTDGAVDPTLGEALVLAGYSRDFAELEQPQDGPPATPTNRTTGPHELSSAISGRQTVRIRRACAWTLIETQGDPPAIRVPAGVRLDLGATAKALAADRAAGAVYNATGSGVLVSLGGDIATAGPAPSNGWAIRVTDDHRANLDAPGQTVTITSGGLATSSVTSRRWLRDGRVMHHILDPLTGQPIEPVWRTTSVAASNCVDANIASTAALVKGRSALTWLSTLKLPSRLVTAAGEVHLLAGWPEDPRGVEI